MKIPSEVLHASTTIVEQIRRVISKFEASKCRKKVPKCRKKCSDMIFAVMVRQNKCICLYVKDFFALVLFMIL